MCHRSDAKLVISPENTRFELQHPRYLKSRTIQFEPPDAVERRSFYYSLHRSGMPRSLHRCLVIPLHGTTQVSVFCETRCVTF